MTIKAVFFEPTSQVWVLVEGYLTGLAIEQDEEEVTHVYFVRERLVNTTRNPVINFDLQFSAREYTVVTEEWVRKHYPTQYKEELDNRRELE